jgi:hypothetical protein
MKVIIITSYDGVTFVGIASDLYDKSVTDKYEEYKRDFYALGGVNMLSLSEWLVKNKYVRPCEHDVIFDDPQDLPDDEE